MNIVDIRTELKSRFGYLLAILRPIAVSPAFGNRWPTPKDAHIIRPLRPDNFNHDLSILSEYQNRPSFLREGQASNEEH